MLAFIISLIFFQKCMIHQALLFYLSGFSTYFPAAYFPLLMYFPSGTFVRMHHHSIITWLSFFFFLPVTPVPHADHTYLCTSKDASNYGQPADVGIQTSQASHPAETQTHDMVIYLTYLFFLL